MDTTNNKEPVIEAKDLAAGYPGKAVWEGASFSIMPGEFVGVLGPNGAGKTTLFRMVLGMEPPLHGTLNVLGASPRRGNPRIGYVPQRHPVDNETGIEALELVRLGLVGDLWGTGLRREGIEEAMQALRDVGAEELAHRRLGALSGGELQRIFLAEALVAKPDLLLLDEPLANLDMRRELSLVRLVNGVARSHGVAVLLIAHNINPLLSALDRVVYVANGKVASGAPSEILTSRSLTDLYGIPIEVLRDSHGRIAIIGIDEAPDHAHHEHENESEHEHQSHHHA